MKDKLHWLAMHGVIRGIAAIGIRRGDLQARLIADPAVATDPVPFYDEVRSHGALVRNRANYLTVDHRLAHDLLRSDDFRVVSFGENLPPPLRWLERRTRGYQLPPCENLRCWPSSRPITLATAKRCRRCSPHGRSARYAIWSNRPRSISWIGSLSSPGLWTS
ncbi:cytochrome p450 140 CYP140 [Mycobacterium tuberculosis]|nr:cytochrome p450 140 CYP140 [Mycobacterium tuberculosis]